MVRHWWQVRAKETGWKKKISVNGFGLLLTGGILILLCVSKFFEGGWITLVVTGALVGVAFWVKKPLPTDTEKITPTQRTRCRRLG